MFVKFYKKDQKWTWNTLLFFKGPTQTLILIHGYVYQWRPQGRGMRHEILPSVGGSAPPPPPSEGKMAKITNFGIFLNPLRYAFPLSMPPQNLSGAATDVCFTTLIVTPDPNWQRLFKNIKPKYVLAIFRATINKIKRNKRQMQLLYIIWFTELELLINITCLNSATE